ncbi:hypothetical protein M378DRAFT_86420 [Amanita muscaria Koide BX008]|uniref:Uncharacterized protein n=1 Tax=Amanita muscaria (strain Koide BX008) TaxID=946122 RepID=A0A0C2WP84_AMAMK|nr:hypothetical protein M378DRAFT_86420 [Amanita muscaria Koide BX008]
MLKDSETTNLVFKRLFAIANASEPADYDTLSTLKKLKCHMLSPAAEEEIIRKDTKDFTLDDTVQTFDLTYSSNLSESAKWKIEELPDVKTFQPSTYLDILLVILLEHKKASARQGRSDASVYGVATDSLSYVFVTITHEGVLKQSRQFNVMKGDLSTVLGCLRYILAMEMSMTAYLTPEKEGLDKSDELEADADDPIDLDDNYYLHHDDEADEYP